MPTPARLFEHGPARIAETGVEVNGSMVVSEQDVRGGGSGAPEVARWLGVALVPTEFDPTDDPQLVRDALRSGHRDRADRVAAMAAHRARACPEITVLAAAAAHAAGLLAGDVEELLRAASLFDADLWPYARASALEDAGVASGDQHRAITVLETAMRLYDRAGATRDAARARARLRRLGVHRRRRVQPGTGCGWAALTPTEREIVTLVCTGATNRQVAAALYLSPHTVSTHLRHVFDKLGIGSRVQLTGIALARAASGEPSEA